MAGDGDLLAAKPWEHLGVGLAKRSLCPILGKKPNRAPERQPMSHRGNRGDSRPCLWLTTDHSTQATAASSGVAGMSIQRASSAHGDAGYGHSNLVLCPAKALPCSASQREPR